MAAVASGLLAYGIARCDARGLVVFLTRAFYVNAWYAQWTPLLVAMWYLPLLAVFVAAKPTIGLAMLTGVREWRLARRGLVLAMARQRSPLLSRGSVSGSPPGRNTSTSLAHRHWRSDSPSSFCAGVGGSTGATVFASSPDVSSAGSATARVAARLSHR
jgi:hypothetical protein